MTFSILGGKYMRMRWDENLTSRDNSAHNRKGNQSIEQSYLQSSFPPATPPPSTPQMARWQQKMMPHELKKQQNKSIVIKTIRITAITMPAMAPDPSPAVRAPTLGSTTRKENEPKKSSFSVWGRRQTHCRCYSVLLQCETTAPPLLTHDVVWNHSTPNLYILTI